MKQTKEPAAIRELHRIREQMLAEEKRVGSATYWAEAHEEALEFMRRPGCKLRPLKTETAGVREHPGKYKTKSR
jgi:hypothetical protein